MRLALAAPRGWTILPKDPKGITLKSRTGEAQLTGEWQPWDLPATDCASTYEALLKKRLDRFVRYGHWDKLRFAGGRAVATRYGYVDGYMYDIQRTLVVGAAPTRAQRRIVDGAWNHVQYLKEHLRGGVTIRELYATGLRFMREHDYEPNFTSYPWDVFPNFGHAFSTGFDWPWISPGAPDVDEPLVAPFAITIEICWEAPDAGSAWVEDNFLVLADGVEWLSAGVPTAPTTKE